METNTPKEKTPVQLCIDEVYNFLNDMGLINKENSETPENVPLLLIKLTSIRDNQEREQKIEDFYDALKHSPYGEDQKKVTARKLYNEKYGLPESDQNKITTPAETTAGG